MALALATFLRSDFGTIASFAVVPILIALAIDVVAAGVRLRRVGILQNQAEALTASIPAPWLRFWLLVRFALLGSIFILFIVMLGMLLIKDGAVAVQALVYVAVSRMMLDLIFRVILNVRVVKYRHGV